MPSQADASQIRRRISAEFSPMPAVKTSPSSPAEHRGERADLLGGAVDEVVDGQLRRRLLLSRSSRMSLLKPDIPSSPDFL